MKFYALMWADAGGCVPCNSDGGRVDWYGGEMCVKLNPADIPIFKHLPPCPTPPQCGMWIYEGEL